MGTAGPLPVGTLFLVAFGALAVFLHPGIFISDEVSQAAGLHALAGGSVLVTDDQPEGYGDFLNWWFWHWGVPRPGEPAIPAVGSPMANLLALPVLAALSSVAAVSSTRVALAVATGLLAYAALRGAWGLATGRRLPRWAGWAVAAAVFPDLLAEDLPAAPYLEIAAIHLLNMAALAWAAALLVDLLEVRVGRRGAVLAAAVLLFASPAFFWASSAKYHALSIALVAVALWTYQAGAGSSPARTFLAYAIGGLALFNYLPIGALLLATLGLLSLPAVRLGARGLGVRFAAAAAGVATGLVPEAIYRWAVSQTGIGQQFIVGVGTEAESSGSVFAQIVDATVGGLFHYSLFGDWRHALPAIAEAIAWPSWPARPMLPLVALAPWALLAVATLASRSLRAQLGRPVWGFAVAHVLVVLAVLGSTLVGTVGFDPRYASTVWPSLVVLASPALARCVARPAAANEFAWAGALAAGLTCLGLVLNMVLHAIGWFLTPQGNVHDQVLVPRLAGYASALAVAAAIPFRRAGAWLGAAAAASIAIAAGTQVLLQLSFGNKMGDAPFVAWPVDLLARAVRWMLFET